MLDPRIHTALAKAVQEVGQPGDLATKLFAWMEQVAIGNEHAEDQDAAARHLELLFKATIVEGEGSEDGE